MIGGSPGVRSLEKCSKESGLSLNLGVDPGSRRSFAAPSQSLGSSPEDVPALRVDEDIALRPAGSKAGLVTSLDRSGGGKATELPAVDAVHQYKHEMAKIPEFGEVVHLDGKTVRVPIVSDGLMDSTIGLPQGR